MKVDDSMTPHPDEDLSHLSRKQQDYIYSLRDRMQWLSRKKADWQAVHPSGANFYAREYYATEFAVWYICNVVSEKDLHRQLKDARHSNNRLRAKLKDLCLRLNLTDEEEPTPADPEKSE
jgi:hypothetical protein